MRHEIMRENVPPWYPASARAMFDYIGMQMWNWIYQHLKSFKRVTVLVTESALGMGPVLRNTLIWARESYHTYDWDGCIFTYAYNFHQ